MAVSMTQLLTFLRRSDSTRNKNNPNNFPGENQSNRSNKPDIGPVHVEKSHVPLSVRIHAGTIEVERNPIAPANWNALSTKSPQTSIILTGLPEYTHSLSKSSSLFFIYEGVRSFNPGPSSCQDTTRKDSRD
ncbi:hypothetical protein K0M31_007441 [Melipona bicolor]|uniref:Uncharacterized protein n=1 Tax=Melipona bicolor TaxID=60889 RepID=A0AA40GCU0_9HYME|nr:hypothetical protein K0M31_007441 [Melipona bicolor]